MTQFSKKSTVIAEVKVQVDDSKWRKASSQPACGRRGKQLNSVLYTITINLWGHFFFVMGSVLVYTISESITDLCLPDASCVSPLLWIIKNVFNIANYSLWTELVLHSPLS